MPKAKFPDGERAGGTNADRLAGGAPAGPDRPGRVAPAPAMVWPPPDDEVDRLIEACRLPEAPSPQPEAEPEAESPLRPPVSGADTRVNPSVTPPDAAADAPGSWLEISEADTQELPRVPPFRPGRPAPAGPGVEAGPGRSQPPGRRRSAILPMVVSRGTLLPLRATLTVRRPGRRAAGATGVAAVACVLLLAMPGRPQFGSLVVHSEPVEVVYHFSLDESLPRARGGEFALMPAAAADRAIVEEVSTEPEGALRQEPLPAAHGWLEVAPERRVTVFADGELLDLVEAGDLRRFALPSGDHRVELVFDYATRARETRTVSVASGGVARLEVPPTATDGAAVADEVADDPGGPLRSVEAAAVAPPEPLDQPLPRVTTAPFPMPRDARAVVELRIDAKGRVVHARLQRSINRFVDERLLTAVRGWRYTPAHRGRRSVSSVDVVEVTYEGGRWSIVRLPPADLPGGRTIAAL